jgi:hypothetical protein
MKEPVRAWWSELLIVATILVLIIGVTSMSSRAMIEHAKSRRTHTASNNQ